MTGETNETGYSNVVTATTLPVAKPTVLSATDATDVSYITAKAAGSVEGADRPSEEFAADFDSDCRFEYVTDAQFTNNGFDSSSRADCSPNPVVGSGPTAVEAELTGLKPGTTYHLRLTASNAGGSDSKEVSTFTTLPVAPPTVLSIEDATDVEYSQAKVKGKVERPAGPDPAAFDANCRFEYVNADEFLANGFTNATPVGCLPEEVITTTGETEVSADLTGLAVGTTYYVRLVASNAGGSDAKVATNTFTTQTPGAPIVSILAPSEVTSTTAKFEGTIDPDGTDPGFNVNWHFECSPACPGLAGTVEADGAGPRPISIEATGLTPNTEYEVTLIAANAGESASAGPEQFTTVAVVPVVATMPAFALADGTSALLGGTINPKHSPTTYWFEYGPDDTYGSSIPLSQDASAGSAEGISFLTQELSGLQPASTYHFRLVAKNPAGTVQGADKTFTTAPAGGLGSSIGDLQLPDNRAWEQVSPVDKNGADIWKVKGQASASGNALTFESQGSFAGQPTSKGGLNSSYLSKRGASSWSTSGITPPGGLFSFNEPGYHEFSDELDFGRLKRFELGSETLDPEFATNPDALAKVGRFYIRDDATGKYKIQPDGFAGASTDYANIAIQSGEKLTPEGCESFCVYEQAGNEIRLASQLEGGTPEYGFYAGIAKDGSHVYFKTLFGEHLYARVDGTETIQLDESERTLPPIGAGAGATLAGIQAPDGERAVFISGEELVDGDEDSANDLYLWDATKPDGQRLTLVSQGDTPGLEAELGGALGNELDSFSSRPDLRRGYFTATNQILAGESGAPGQKIYSWDASGAQPTISYVATADVSVGGGVRVSSDGRYLAFASNDRLTAYDNAGKQEVYRYDGEAEQLVCVSCEPHGAPATSDAAFNIVRGGASGGPSEVTIYLPHVLRNLTPDGKVFFESEEALVPQDSNGLRDVYEYANDRPYLISSGTGGLESRFLDASASGDDVFFATADTLVGWDSGRDFDAYDARVDGGLPEPPPGIIGCDGDACQAPPTPPNDASPASARVIGAGNAPQKPAKKKKHKKKQHKKQKKQKQKQQRAKQSQQAPSTHRHG